MLGFFFVFSFTSLAEPWLSNRYAENCAACHAPGRLNKPAKGRRCTLACQGCHVNPQGGGLRNQYGIWNQQRWLRSFRTDLFKDKPTPAPFSRQPYADRVKYLASHAREFYHGRRPQSDSRARMVRNAKLDKNKKNKRNVEAAAPPPEPPEEMQTASADEIKEGPDARYIRNMDPPLSMFDKNSYDAWYAVVDSESDFLSTIPKGDPYRLERDLSLYAGGDLRWFMMEVNKPLLAGKKERSWLMGADIGVRAKPTRYHNLSAVIEARFENNPDGQNPEDGFTSHAEAKSAYLLWDDLAYDSFVQLGLYRPMFGLYDVDHDSLSSKISGLTQDALFKSFAVGTAPNVPFVIVNYIQPYNRNAGEFGSSHGFVLTGGLRFVTMGASLTGSYWNTQYFPVGQTIETRREMYSLTGGVAWKRLIVNFETLRAQKSADNGAKSAGNVYTLQTKYRFYREMYAEFNYEMSNVARDLSPGKGTETMIGFKTFPISDLELETLYITRNYNENNTTAGSYNVLQIQAHVFF